MSSEPPIGMSSISSGTQSPAQRANKNRPKDSKLRQQKLPAWMPTMNAKAIIPLIFFVAVVFIPVGIALIVASNNVQQLIMRYDQSCPNGTCVHKFHLTADIKGDVYFYYGLVNFFQNHRRYLKSRSDKQLLGNLAETTGCDPFVKSNGMNIAPCGAIANSMFNDTFKLLYQIPGENETVVPWTHKDTTWSVDRERRFRNPTIPAGGTLCTAFANTSRPPNWVKSPCELDPTDPSNNGFQNSDFINWMRAAALPDFRKPYRKLVRENGIFSEGLPLGDYVLIIENNFPVRMFNGQKSFIISTSGWAGGKNSFLGVMYVIVGGFLAFVGVVFTFIHLKYGFPFVKDNI